MALRLIEMVLQEQDGGEIRELLKEHKVLEHRQVRLPDGEVLVRILPDAKQGEAVMDLLAERYAGTEGTRVVILPVEATLSRAEPEPAAAPGQPPSEEAPPGRIGREELHEDIKDGARCSRVYLTTVVLSPVVAGIGLHHNSVTIIIGAMVMAPFLGVKVAVAILPPLVASGLLLGGGHPALAIGALSLFLLNLICVNLAGVITFLAQGIRPATWREKDRAKKATLIAIGLWAGLELALTSQIPLPRRG